MPDVTLVSPPDILTNNELSLLLIYPQNNIKTDLQDILLELQVPIVVYLYEPPVELEDPDWLLTMFNTADIVVLDIDNSEMKTRDLASYFVSFDKTLWLTNGSGLYYNKLSVNRIYDLNYLKERIGAQLEKTKK